MNEDSFERIDKYLNGEMSREEQLLFEAEITENGELASLVNMYRVIEKDMSENEKYYDGELALKKTLAEMNSRYFKDEGLFAGEREDAGILRSADASAIKNIKANKPAVVTKAGKINMAIRLAVAASVIGIIAVGVNWYTEKQYNLQVAVANKIKDSSKRANSEDTSLLNKNNPVNEVAKQDEKKIEIDTVEAYLGTLYAQNFKPDQAPDYTEGSVLEDGFDVYQHKRYAMAITAFDRADTTLVTRGEDGDQEHTIFYKHYYKALSYMALKNIKKAIPELDMATAHSPEPLLTIKSQWYLSLAYIKTNDLHKARELLKLIADNKESALFKTKAQKLMQKLPELN